MKQSFPKKVAILCLSAVMSLGLCLGFTSIVPVGAASATLYDVAEITDGYRIDTSVTVSDTADATKTIFPKEISINDAKAEISTVKYPDGYERSVSDEFVLDQLGLYNVTYKTDDNVCYFDKFVVYDNFADIDGEGTLQNYEEDGAVKGITAIMQPGTQIVFNKIIDLTQVDPETGCVDLFSARFNTLVNGSTLVEYTEFVIEDVNDPNVFVKIIMQQDNVGYFRVSTKDLPDAGLGESDGVGETLTGSKKGLVTYINGVRYKNYFGRLGRKWIGSSTVHAIRYNPVTQRFYRDNASEEHKDANIFADLRNVDGYDQGSKFFDGFPSKAVKMTLRGTEYKSAFTLDITQIGDSKGEELASLIESGIDDTKAPILEVNSVPTSQGSVYGKLGSNFVIPSATSVDANDASPVAINVYKNYVDESKVYVPIQDGKVKLDEQTVYTIEYTSYDKYGNLAIKTLKVEPKTTADLEGYDHIEGVNISLGVNKISLKSGEDCNANVYEVFSTLNSASALTLDVDVTHAGKSVFAKSFNGNDIAKGNLKFDFIPIAVGDYVVTYTYGDNVESGSFNYTVQCTSSSNVINFKEKPFLYRTYIYGMQYDVSQHVAYQFGDSITAQPTTVEISYDNGETWTKVGKTFVIGEDANGEVPLTQSVETIKFRYTSGSAVQVTDSATIVDVRKDTTKKLSLIINKKQGIEGNVDYTKYFYIDEFEVTSNDRNKYVFDAKNNTGSAVLKANNPMTFDKKGKFYTAFSTDNKLRDYSKVTISLIDAYDSTNVLNFHYEVVKNKDAEETLIYTDDSRKFCITDFPLFSADEKDPESDIDFAFSVSNQIITACGKQFSAEFRPTNDLFYVQYTISGISGENAAISLTVISNVSLSSTTVTDISAPVFYYQSSAGTYALGSVVTIFAPQATDFCTPYVQQGRTTVVVAINNKPIKSVDGTLLDGKENDPTKNYDILVDQLMVYKVTYTVLDDAKMSDTISYKLQGADKVDPVITLGYDFNEKTIHNVTLGKPFTIDYTISDDVSTVENCYGRVIIINDLTSRAIYAADPMETAENKEDYKLITDSCTITVKGMYTVYVYARDEAGNTVYASYKLNVQ